VDYRYTFIGFGHDADTAPAAVPIPGLRWLQDRLGLSHKSSMWTTGVTVYFSYTSARGPRPAHGFRSRLHLHLNAQFDDPDDVTYTEARRVEIALPHDVASQATNTPLRSDSN
jgi:hypothetical protein